MPKRKSKHPNITDNVNKYMVKTYKRYTIIVRKDNEQDIIEMLDSQESYTKYIKTLIKKDMEAKKWQYQIMR